jgi:hypothetical protein
MDKIELITKYDFKCDCLACTDDVRKFIPVQLWRQPSTFMSRANLEEAKECLKEGNYYINMNTKSSEDVRRYLDINFSIFDTLAYYCTFPC